MSYGTNNSSAEEYLSTNDYGSPRHIKLVQHGVKAHVKRHGRHPAPHEMVSIKKKAKVLELARNMKEAKADPNAGSPAGPTGSGSPSTGSAGMKTADAAGAVLNAEKKDCGVRIEIAGEKVSNRFVVAKDNMIHVVPYGEYPHPSGLKQTIDERAVDSMLNDFKQKKVNNPGHALLADFDHHSQDGDKKSEAAGWITDLEKRNNGLWGKVAWSDAGKENVSNGRYRYVSPVWLRSDCEQIGTDPNDVRPTALTEIGLTNNPNMPGMTPLSAIVNAQQKLGDEIAAMIAEIKK